MTTLAELQSRLRDAKSRAAGLDKAVEKDGRTYLTEVIAQGPHACLSELAQSSLILAPSDRRLLCAEVAKVVDAAEARMPDTRASSTRHRRRGFRIDPHRLVSITLTALLVYLPAWTALAFAVVRSR